MDHSDAFDCAALAANPTWPTGAHGGKVSAAPVPATAQTRAGVRVLLKGIYFCPVGGVAPAGFIILKHGDGVTNYFGGLAFNASQPSLPRPSDIELWNGLSVDSSGLTAGAVLIEYKYNGVVSP